MKRTFVLLFALTLILSGICLGGSVGSGTAIGAAPQIGYVKRKTKKVAHRTKYHTKRISHKTKRGTQAGYTKTKHTTKKTYSKTKNKIEH
jgi:gas vesicle protein